MGRQRPLFILKRTLDHRGAESILLRPQIGKALSQIQTQPVRRCRDPASEMLVGGGQKHLLGWRRAFIPIRSLKGFGLQSQDPKDEEPRASLLVSLDESQNSSEQGM